jgi:hypothetical protein
MTEPANKAEFEEQLQQSWSELQGTLDGFSKEQMTQRTDHVGWTVKDHLSHLVSWERGIIALLRRRPRWEAMGVDLATATTRLNPNTEDELNQIMRDAAQSLSLAEVREQLSQTHDELADLVDSMEAEDLLKTYSHYAPDEPGNDSGAPVLGWVVGNSSAHYEEHLPWIREIAGGAS